MKIISIVNQKGGVGKTTTAIHLASGLAQKGKRVCLIDFDPQANASNYLGYDNENGKTISNLVVNYAQGKELQVGEVIKTSDIEGIDYIPADIRLSAAELMLVQSMAREKALSNILKEEEFGKYDYIIIDCLPSLGVLMVNALCASTDVIVPVQCQKFSIVAVDQLMETIAKVRRNLNDKLEILGILATMQNNTNMSKSVIQGLNIRFGGKMFNTAISQLTEAVVSTALCKSLITDKKSKVGEQYRQVVEEVIERTKKSLEETK